MNYLAGLLSWCKQCHWFIKNVRMCCCENFWWKSQILGLHKNITFGLLQKMSKSRASHREYNTADSLVAGFQLKINPLKFKNTMSPFFLTLYSLLFTFHTLPVEQFLNPKLLSCKEPAGFGWDCFCSRSQHFLAFKPSDSWVPAPCSGQELHWDELGNEQSRTHRVTQIHIFHPHWGEFWDFSQAPGMSSPSRGWVVAVGGNPGN